jgi:hypothetical protein
MTIYHYLLAIPALFVLAWFIQTDDERDLDRKDFRRFIVIPAKQARRFLARLYSKR